MKILEQINKEDAIKLMDKRGLLSRYETLVKLDSKLKDADFPFIFVFDEEDDSTDIEMSFTDSYVKVRIVVIDNRRGDNEATHDSREEIERIIEEMCDFECRVNVFQSIISFSYYADITIFKAHNKKK